MKKIGRPRKPFHRLSYTRKHERLRELFITEQSVCETCGISETSHRQKLGRGLEIHCINGKYNLDRNNYSILCHNCHRKLSKHTWYEEKSKKMLKHKLNGKIVHKRNYRNLKMEAQDDSQHQ